ncbi:MAG: alcohol dehydrogenase catalytic domain-containing protein [Pirellulales bacterium]
MRAMLLEKIVSLQETDAPLTCVEQPVPKPAAGEIQIHVSACGVCHTELDEIEGRTPPPALPVIPGHQVVGHVSKLGAGVTKWSIGDRVGVGWIYESNGSTDENLAAEFRATGRDANGGYAEFMVVPENYAYAIPPVYSDVEAAPLLCAGAVGYRALKLTNLRDGEPLGLTGFGGSNHLVLQLARHLYPNSPIAVFARDPEQRRFALQLGANWAGATNERAPEPLQSIIDTTPAWTPVVEALANLRPGGRLVINAIRKVESDKQALQQLSYQEHLWMEREIKSVANVTRFDLQEFLPLAAAANLRPEVTVYPLESANVALAELHRGAVRGAKVLRIN